MNYIKLSLGCTIAATTIAALSINTSIPGALAEGVLSGIWVWAFGVIPCLALFRYILKASKPETS